MRDIQDQKFTRLRALRYLTGGRWLCQCDCGAQCTVPTYRLTSGQTKSCGCYRRDHLRANRRAATHGESTNGGSNSPEYRTWANMKSRCQNPDHKLFPLYGARGIRVCESWQAFEGFLADMGRRPSPKHSIDRIDNDGNYEPGNCRWVTSKTQNRNTRNNRMITVNGVTRPLAEWLETAPVSRRTFYRRVRKGASDVEALGMAR